MLRLKKIAITGGVASGKTTVCQFFKKLGACVVNADAIVHELLRPNTDLGQQIIRQLGPEIIENGQFSRRIIAEKVFKDAAQLKKFEELIHPQVFQKIATLYSLACIEDRYTSFVVEIPLLFEVGAEKFYDFVVVVLSSEEAARKRFEQAGFQQTEYDLRMKRQIKPEIKATKAHYTIHNNGSLEQLHEKVIQLNHTIHKQ